MSVSNKASFDGLFSSLDQENLIAHTVVVNNVDEFANMSGQSVIINDIVNSSPTTNIARVVTAVGGGAYIANEVLIAIEEAKESTLLNSEERVSD